MFRVLTSIIRSSYNLNLYCVVYLLVVFCVLDYSGKKFQVGKRMGGFQGASSSLAITKSHSEFPVSAGLHSTDMHRIRSAHP